MLQEERFLLIVDYLKENRTATLAELAEINEVAVDTIRRDLVHLESNGMLKRVRGGAVYRKDDLTKQAFDMRGIEHKAEKKELASLVNQVVEEGQSLALNSGTTNIEVAKSLVKNYDRLTILTNNLRIIDILERGRNFTIIVPGGIFDNEEYAIFGDKCEKEILNYNIDTALLAINALSLEKGVTDFRTWEVGIVRSMLKVSKNKVIVADLSKFDRVACMNVCKLDEIDYIITNSGLQMDKIKKYEQANIKVIMPRIKEDR